jgi:uncharacterized protein YidB (DUF937 family)
MGLLDIAQELLGGSQSSGAGDIVNTFIRVLNGRAGGLDGIVQSLQQGGLGDAVNSWVGTGQNAPVSGEQLESVLGSGVIQDLASKLGIPAADASAHLSALLPGIIDHLTPNGEMPQGGLAGAGMNFVKGTLSRNLAV